MRAFRRARIFLVSTLFVTFQLIRIRLSLKVGPLATPGESWSNEAAYAVAEDASLIVFYNLFIPHSTEGVSNAINVVTDQMTQVSSALHRQGGHVGRIREERGVVFYNVIGNEAAFPSTKMSDLCHQLHPRLTCQLLKHYENATESVTLTSLYEFCHSSLVRDSKNETRVVYLHSKGSYHNHEKQRSWRREITNSSLHTDCLSPPEERCDVCGAQYYSMPASMFPGNMWTAKCDYIKKLLPPDEGGEYERQKEEALKQFFKLRSQGIVHNTLGFHQDVFYGFDRYQWEHWVGSHPSIVPCEMHSVEVAFWDITQGEIGQEHYEWGMGPRRHMVFDKPGQPRPYLSTDEEKNFREYYYLAGNMIKWVTLYGTVPAQDSWVWSRFPAGPEWKDLVGKYGENAISALVQSSKTQHRSVFAPKFSKRAFIEEDLYNANPPLVVFYQISFPSQDMQTAVAAMEGQFDALSMGQYDNATKSFDQGRRVLVYYSISGGSQGQKELASELCRKHSAVIKCHLLGLYDADFVSGETLSQLHTFCNANPSFNVIYMSNVLPGLNKDDSEPLLYSKLKGTTLAIMSKTCQPSSKTCNVCGTEFYPLPFSHFIGNMFSASCGYVKDLLPPKILEREMDVIAGEAFLAHLKKQFTAELFKFTPRILGMKPYSVEHWIGSHPDLKPCDQLEFSLSWSLAPRRGSAPPGYLSREKEHHFRLKRDIAFREYYYLAGNIFRWHTLYNKIPPSNSWVWQWFPDGQLWNDAARKSGVHAVNDIARHLKTDSGMEQFWVK